MPHDNYSPNPGDSNSEGAAPQDSHASLRLLTEAVWKHQGNDGDCPPDRYPSFRQLDELITTTAWRSDAREEFFHRWQTLEPSSEATIETGGSFSELAHLVWEEAAQRDSKLKHPLAPLIAAWQSGQLEVQAVRDSDGSLRADAILPRLGLLFESCTPGLICVGGLEPLDRAAAWLVVKRYCRALDGATRKQRPLPGPQVPLPGKYPLGIRGVQSSQQVVAW